MFSVLTLNVNVSVDYMTRHHELRGRVTRCDFSSEKQLANWFAELDQIAGAAGKDWEGSVSSIEAQMFADCHRDIFGIDWSINHIGVFFVRDTDGLSQLEHARLTAGTGAFLLRVFGGRFLCIAL